MHFRGLDLNLLVTLDALLAEKSISRAGKRVQLSQSATSGALARLRQFFSDELLVQVGREMILTPRAEGLVEPVRDLLLQTESIIRKNPVFDPATSTRKFSLVASDYVATVLMTEALPRLQCLAPRIALEMVWNVDRGISDSFERGEVDFMIMPIQYRSPNHPSENLFDDEFTCVVWSDNKLAGNRISLAKYLSLGHVVVRFGEQHQMASFYDEFMDHHGHRRRVEVIATAFNLVPQLLIGTTRIALLHRRLAEYYARYLPVRLLPPPIKIPRLVEVIQWHKYRERDPGNAWLRNVLKSSLR